MIGTSGALRVCDRAEPPAPPPALWCYRADAERILLGGSLSDGGSVVAWLRTPHAAPGPGRGRGRRSPRWLPTPTG